jgi:hypothetical protein
LRIRARATQRSYSAEVLNPSHADPGILEALVIQVLLVSDKLHGLESHCLRAIRRFTSLLSDRGMTPLRTMAGFLRMLHHSG